VSLEAAETTGADFTTRVGAASLKALRKVPADRLLQESAKGQYSRGFTIDGYFFPEDPAEILFSGRQNDVPLLAGWNSAEVAYQSVLGDRKPTKENYLRALTELYGMKADEVFQQYPANTPQEVLRAASDLAGDRFCGYRTWKWIDLASKSGGQPVYRYLFNQIPPSPDATTPADKPLGAPHSAEIPYALGNLDQFKSAGWSDSDRRVARIMQSYFVNFIKIGNPNGPSLLRWPWLQASIPRVMVLGADYGSERESNASRYLLLDRLAETAKVP
jgi:para-nitrobenzyl esterase